MEQITFEELKQLFGCESNNDFANKLSICMDEAVRDNINRGYEDYANLLRKRSKNIYDKLDELGYYDDVKEVR